ncbi:hypothetical protein JCM6882_004716 [Rhodosporidiobolus microsporus]
MSPARRPAASKKPLGGSWSPSPSPSPPASPSDLSISDADRFRLLEEYAPLKPSELPRGPSGAQGRTSAVKAGGKGKGREPLVVVSPEELEEMVRRQQEGAGVGTDDDEDDYGEPEPAVEEEEPEMWEELANAVLWSIPFGFLFVGMDYAAHTQFGQWLVPKEELSRLLNILPALLLLNFLTLRPPSRRVLPPLLLQPLLLALSLFTGLSLIHTTTTAGYLSVMARAPALGVLWCWTVVMMDLWWAVAALVGVAIGVTVRGEGGAVKWWD